MNSSLISIAFAKLAVFLIVALPLLGSNVNAFQEDSVEVDFVTDIKPIFENHCLKCHGPETADGFRIDDRDEAFDYITPEDPDDSILYEYLITDSEDELMPPPDEGGPLPESDIQLIKTWIEAGAEWPDDVEFVAPVEEAETAEAKKEEPPSPYKAIGSLHPAAIHIPAGLLFAAGLFAFLGLRGNFVMSDCAFYCLWLGTLGAIFACVTGWYFGDMEHYAVVNDADAFLDTTAPLFWHRTSAIVVTALALFLALYATSSRYRDPDSGIMWKFGAILIAAGVGYVGHEGGELSWNKDGKHYQDLNRIMEQYIPILKQQEENPEAEAAVQGKDTATDTNESDTNESDNASATESDDESATGTTSEDDDQDDTSSETEIE